MSMDHAVSVGTYPENAGSSRPITVNGVNLHTLAYNIDTRTGMAGTAGLRGANAEPPGRDGVLWSAGKPSDTMTLKLSMWASPVRVDGSRPATESEAYDNWRRNQDLLNELFDTRTNLLTVRMQTSAGEFREALCEVTRAIDPEIQVGHMSNFDVELVVVGAFWQDIANSLWQSPAGAAAVGTHSVTTMLGSTAPNNELLFSVTGPIANPRITDFKTGHYIQLNQTLATGVSWNVDAKDYTSKVGATPATNNTVTSGVFNPRFMVISSGLAVAPKVQLSGSSAAAATRLYIVGRRKFR